MNKKINIKKIFPTLLFCLMSFVLVAQEYEIKGTVTGELGEKLENVLISVVETPTVNSYTDAQGLFSLMVEANQHLRIEYKNEFQKIIKVPELDENIEIVLDYTSQLVDTGYNAKLRAEELASSIGYVKTEQLERTNAFTLGEALFGQVNGLRVYQNTGQFPEDREPRMDIRGVSTTQNNNILVLIDGAERPLNSVVPEEVESVTVLKDVAAKARYGLRGGNGVLLVKTKRGNVGETRFNVSFESGISQPTRVPRFLNASNYARAVNEALFNDGSVPQYSQLEIDRYQSGEYPTLYPDVNWVDETLSNFGQFSKFNFSAEGGNKNVTFHLGFHYQNYLGMYNGTERFDDFSTQLNHDRLNFRNNLDIKLTSSTKVEVDVSGYFLSEKGPGQSGIVSSAFEIPSLAFPVRNEKGWGGTNQFGNNPLALIGATGYRQDIRLNIMTNIRLKQDLSSLVEGLSAELFGGYRNMADYNENSTKDFEYVQITPVTDVDGNVIGQNETVLGNETDLNASRSAGAIESSYDIQGTVNYTKQFQEHSIDGFVLFQQEGLNFKGANNTFRYQNVVSNIHYGFNNKYFIDATLAYSGTNRINEKEDRFGLFPAIGTAWTVSNENFMKGITFLDKLKLRASFGKIGNGNVPIGDLTNDQFGGVSGYRFGNNSGFSGGLGQTQIGIDNKKIETSLESNIGIDALLFGKLSLNGELFYIKRENILVPTVGQYSQALGLSPGLGSDGTVENKGYELGVTWSDQSGELKYSIAGRFSQYKNKIININEEFRPFDYLKREGQSIGQQFGWQSEGLYQNQNEISQGPVSAFGDLQPGDVKYVDQNNDGMINEFDQLPIGNSSIPEIYYSADFNIGYKGFKLTALFQGTGKSSTFLNNRHVFWPLRENDNMSTWYQNYWSQNSAGNNQQAAVLPRLSRGDNNHNFRANNIWIRNNSFMKLRYAELSYSLPKRFISNSWFENVEIYIQGTNLLTFDDIEYVDPENASATYPSLRSYNSGIKLTF